MKSARRKISFASRCDGMCPVHGSVLKENTFMMGAIQPGNYKHSRRSIHLGLAGEEILALPTTCKGKMFYIPVAECWDLSARHRCCRDLASVQEISPPKVDFCEHVLFTADTMLAVWIYRQLE